MRVTTLTNIGPALERLLSEINIHSTSDFLERDPYDLYAELKKIHPRLHPAVFACFTGARTKTPWYFIYKETKAELLERAKH